MSKRVVITDAGERDLDEILRYLALDDARAGRRFVAAPKRKIATSRQMPERCPLAPEDGLDGLEIRHLLHGHYRILFTIEPDRVVVLQVRHGSRLPMRGGES